MLDYYIHGKTAKEWVNEICLKMGAIATYTVRDAVPGEIPARFICTCVITGINKTLSIENAGKSKKEAEQRAAHDMLYYRLGMTPAKFFRANNGTTQSMRAWVANAEIDL